MNRHIDKTLYQQARQLRSQGLTYRQVGAILQISEGYARHLASFCEIIQQRDRLWTEGLSSRVSLAMRHAGYHSREELLQVMRQTPNPIKQCLGIGRVGLRDLKAWLGI